MLKEIIFRLERGQVIDYNDFKHYAACIRAYFIWDKEYIIIESIANNLTVVSISNDITLDMEKSMANGHTRVSLLEELPGF